MGAPRQPRLAAAGGRRFLHHLTENDRAVVLTVSCGVDQRDSSAARTPCESAERSRRVVLAQLGAGAADEAAPSGRIVTEPSSQPDAGSHLLEPLAQTQGILPNAPRSQTLDQHAPAVAWLWRLVGPLESDPSSHPLLRLLQEPEQLAVGSEDEER